MRLAALCLVLSTGIADDSPRYSWIQRCIEVLLNAALNTSGRSLMKGRVFDCVHGGMSGSCIEVPESNS